MNFLRDVLVGTLLFSFLVCAAPFLLLWFCVDLISIKFGGGK